MIHNNVTRTVNKSDLHSLWNKAINPLVINEYNKNTIVKMALEYNIPLTKQDIRKALNVVKNDNENGTANKQYMEIPIIDIMEFVVKDLEDGPTYAIATQYPLFYALTSTKWFGGSDFIDSIARYHMRKIAEHEFDQSDPRIVYQDILAARGCVYERYKRHKDDDAGAFWALATHHIVSAMDPATRDRLGGNATRLEQILTGERGLGQRRRTRRAGGGGGRGRGRIDRGLVDRVERHVPGHARRNVPETEDRDTMRAADSAHGVPEGFDAAVHGAEVPAPEETAEPLEVQRTAPSLATRRDDQANLREHVRVAATSALPGEADPHRLPAVLVAHAVAIADTVDPGAWAFALLLLSTGMPWRRLRTLQATSAPGHDRPHWDPATGCLSFTLRDGPATDEHDDSNARVVLVLPGPIHDALASTGAEHPFEGSVTSLSQRLRTSSRRMPGPAPTLTRLRASAWRYVRAYAHDSVAAASLRGEYGRALAACAAYRALHGREIQTVFARTVRALAETITPSEAAPDAWQNNMAGLAACVADTDAARGIGSRRACNPAVYRSWFDGLREALFQRLPELQAPAFTRTETLIDILNLWGCHIYLGFLLATGVRPGGDRARAISTPLGWLISDKASPTYSERRLLPALPEIERELSAHEQYIASLGWENWCTRVGWSDEAKRKSLYPLHLVYINDRITVWRLRNRDFFAKMNAHVIDTTNVAANATRHSFATHLRDRLYESELDALMGHARAGADLAAPNVLARRPTDAHVSNSIREFIRWCGYREIAEHTTQYGFS